MARTKKEIDKDLMYKKLMPSAPRQGNPEGSTREKVDAGGRALSAEDAAEEAQSNRQRPAARREVGVPSLDTQPTVLINVMESIVLEKLDSVLARFKCCKCDRCKKDIVALALNKLPPKYMVLMAGRPTPDIDPQTNAQVLSAMIQAVLAVRAHPRH
jgi:hypothetical protein